MKKTKNIPESNPLRVLILEDNPADAELIVRELRQAKIQCTARLTSGKREFVSALIEFGPQVILSDFKLPRFDGLAALEIARTQAPGIPFIFVSGSIGEEKAIELLAQGASDYIFKDNLQRLGPAVKRELEATRLKLEKKEADRKLQLHVNEMRLLTEASDRFVHINDLDEIYEYLSAVINEISGADYLLLSLYDETLQAVRPKIVSGFETLRETMRRRFRIDPMQMVFYLKDMQPDDFADFVSRRLLPVPDGLYELANRKLPRPRCRAIEKLLAIDSMHTMGFSWENQLFGGLTIFFKEGNALSNATQIEALVNLAAVAIKRLLTEESLRKSEERFRHISETMSDIAYSCLPDAERSFSLSWMTGAAERITGYTIEELLAMKCWGKLVLADDFPNFENYVTGLSAGNSGICELRLRHKNGDIVWVQSFAECTQSPEQPGSFILYGGLVDISERKRIEIALRESEEKYRTLVTQSPDGIFIIDLQGNFLSVNQTMYANLKYSEAELLSMNLRDIVPEQYLDLHKKRLAEIMKGKSQNEAAEYEVRAKGGENHHIAILSAPYYKDNELIGFQGIARDITEKKKMEIRLRESEEYYRTLVETSPDAIIIVDGGGRCKFASPKAYEIFGIPEQIPIIGTSIMDFVEPGETQNAQGRMVEILSGRSSPEIRGYGLRKHGGQPFWGEVTSAPLRDATGRNTGLLLIIRDISERRRAEAALQESEEKYRLIADNTAETITVLDMNLALTYVSPSIFKLRGFTVEETMSQTLQKILTPDSLAKIQEVLGEEMTLETSGNANPKRSRSLELQEYHKDGSIVWVENSLSYLRDAQGKAIGFLAVAKDINERKRAEAELLREKAFLEKLVEAAPEGIAITDCPGRVLRVNGEFARMFGYPADEIVGKMIDDLIAPPGYQEEAGSLTRSSGAGEKVAMETVRRKKDGTLFNVSIIGAPVLIAGQQVAVYAIYHDISERKQAEELIRNSLKEKEVLLQEVHHRVKNNLQIISGLLTLQAEQSAGKSLDEIFHESQDRIRSIALIHEKLYQSHNLAEIAFDEYLHSLVDNLCLSYGVAAGRITIQYALEPILFSIEKAIPLGLIVNELVTNILKHAFPAGRQGEIRIGLHGYKGAKSYALKTKSGTLHIVPTCELTVADDGVGLPADQISGQQKSLGMNLVSMLARQIKAELKIKTGPGTEFRFLFQGLPENHDIEKNNHGG